MKIARHTSNMLVDCTIIVLTGLSLWFYISANDFTEATTAAILLCIVLRCRDWLRVIPRYQAVLLTSFFTVSFIGSTLAEYTALRAGSPEAILGAVIRVGIVLTFLALRISGEKKHA